MKAESSSTSFDDDGTPVADDPMANYPGFNEPPVNARVV